MTVDQRGLWVRRGDRKGWDLAMRDIVFGVSVAIIVLEVVLLMIGLDMATGVEPSMFAAP
jgi:hypothetical protein